MTPVRAAFLAVAASGTLCALVGVAAGRWWARCEWATERAYTRQLEGELARVDFDNAELRQGIPAVWDAGYKAGRHIDEARLVIAQVEQRQRERARWN